MSTPDTNPERPQLDRSAYQWYDIASERASRLIGVVENLQSQGGPGEVGRNAVVTKLAPRIDMLVSALVVAEAVERLITEAQAR